ncbi:uncharacterized protein [Typha angustifolia]|uniref:uncharacterized protein isoform X2 n=1 Tax=Typha angustifolia TaxID=59011 RepID=UPI003C2FADB3
MGLGRISLRLLSRRLRRAAGGDRKHESPYGAMEASVVDGRDVVVEDLRSQLMSLRIRVEELERENGMLLSRLLGCRCSKEKDAVFLPIDGLSLGDSVQGEQQQDEFSATRAPDDAQNFAPFTSSAETHDSDKEGSGLHAEISTKFMEHKSSEITGCSPRITHHCSKRYIALKIMYFGQRYHGFASEAHVEPTIESEIFKALERTKLLIGSKEDSHYSRCGRTDKGVSSTGQVISLYIRSNMRGIGGNGYAASEGRYEIDYVRVLNRVLPKDIRVIGWCPVPTDFHARFTCLTREYRYLFWKGNLDIMRAAADFIGEHDFRNFCKMDAANVSNYRRRITIFNISPCNQRSNDDELWAMTIKGSAFLWHQVRCMVAVLFMIGQGLESPNIVDALLDTSKIPKKPQYNMAPELPLLLHSCEFDNIKFICSSDASQAVSDHLKKEYHNYMLQAAIFFEALSCLCFPDAENSSLVPKPDKKKRGHIPLMLRQTEPSYEERRAKLDMKTTNKSFIELSARIGK